MKRLSKRPSWGPYREEDLAGLPPGNLSLEMLSQSLPDLLRQREPFLCTALPAHPNCSPSPVNVFELETTDFATPEPEPRQEEQHRPVSPPDRRASIGDAQEPLDFLIVQSLGEPSDSPAGRAWQACRDVVVDETTDQEKPAEHPERGGDHLDLARTLSVGSE
jgi:hypothetical protein